MPQTSREGEDLARAGPLIGRFETQFSAATVATASYAAVHFGGGEEKREGKSIMDKVATGLNLAAKVARLVCFVGVAVICAPGSKAMAEDRYRVQDFGDKQLSFTLPSGYQLGYTRQTDDFLIREYVPNGQNVYNWTSMITVTIDGKRVRSGAHKVAQLADHFQRNCYGNFDRKRIRYVPPEGLLFRIVALGCGQYEAHESLIGETVVLLAADSNHEVVTLQYAIRAAPKDSPPELDSVTYRNYLVALTPKIIRRDP